VNLGAPELLIVLLVVLVLFGGAKLPKLARSLGEAKKEFADGMNDSKDKAPEDDKPSKPSTS
jgi:sec-independent protein translocase protein TatA